MSINYEKTSLFIERTVPPGYAVGRFTIGGSKKNQWYVRGVSWTSGFFVTEDEARRVCWRHWTAEVLWGRQIDWSYNLRIDSEPSPAARCEGAFLSVYLAMGEVMFFDISFESQDEIPVARCVDIDEAMARFAALVLANSVPCIKRNEQ